MIFDSLTKPVFLTKKDSGFRSQMGCNSEESLMFLPLQGAQFWWIALSGLPSQNIDTRPVKQDRHFDCLNTTKKNNLNEGNQLFGRLRLLNRQFGWLNITCLMVVTCSICVHSQPLLPRVLYIKCPLKSHFHSYPLVIKRGNGQSHTNEGLDGKFKYK